MLRRWTGPGIFVTSAVARAGKTNVAGAIARSLHLQGFRVGVLKPIDTRCARRREGLVSEDAEILAHRGDVAFPLDVICPVRSRETLPRAVTGETIDWSLVQQSLNMMQGHVDAMVVEGAGGIMSPVDATSTNLDMARWLGLPAVVAVRPGDEAMNQMLSCVELLRGAGLGVAGIVLNAYDPEKASATDERMLSFIERRTQTRLLAVLPDEPAGAGMRQSTADAAAKVDWATLARMAADGD